MRPSLMTLLTDDELRNIITSKLDHRTIVYKDILDLTVKELDSLFTLIVIHDQAKVSAINSNCISIVWEELVERCIAKHTPIFE